MREHIELTGRAQALLADLATYPTGMTSRWARGRWLLPLSLTLLTWLAGALLAAGVAQMLLRLVDPLWAMASATIALWPASLLLGAGVALGAGWLSYCARHRDPWRQRRLQAAYELMARLAPLCDPEASQHRVRLCHLPQARGAGALTLELLLHDGVRLFVDVGEGDASLLRLEVQGLAPPPELERLLDPSLQLSAGGRRFVLRGPGSLHASMGLWADWIAWLLLRCGARVRSPSPQEQPVYRESTASDAAQVPVHLLSSRQPFGQEPSAHGSSLRGHAPSQMEAWAPTWWAGRFRRRILLWSAWTAGLMLGVPLLARYEPWLLEGTRVAWLVGLGVLVLGMPVSLGWWWQPRRRVQPRGSSPWMLGLLHGQLALSWGAQAGQSQRVDLRRPFEVHLSRDKGCRGALLGVEVRQRQPGGQWARVGFCVEAAPGPALRGLPRLRAASPRLGSRDFLSWVWPALAFYGAAHGLSLPAAVTVLDELA